MVMKYRTLNDAATKFPRTPDRLFCIVNDLIQENINNQHRMRENGDDAEETMGPFGFAREFKTVQVSTHRRAGHSYVAASLMQEYPNSILVLPNDRVLSHVVASYPELREQRVITPNISDVELNLMLLESDPLYGKINLLVIDPYSSSILGSHFDDVERAERLFDVLGPRSKVVVKVG